MRRPNIWGSHVRRSLLCAALLIGMTWLLILIAGRIAHPQLRLSATREADGWALANFHEVECNEDDCYRWSQPSASLFFYALDGSSAALELRLTSPRPPGAAPATLSLTPAGHSPSSIPIASAWRRYRMLIPTAATRDTRLRLESQGFQPGGDDTRRLGVAIGSLELRPLVAAPTPQRTAFLLLLPLLAWWLVRRSGGSMGFALGASVALAALAGWAAADPISSGYLLPTVGAPQGRLASLALLLAAPLVIRRLYGYVPYAPWSGVALLIVALLGLRLAHEVATGLAILLIGTLIVLARGRASLSQPAGDSPVPERATAASPQALADQPAVQTLAVLTGVRFIAAIAVVLFHYQRLIPYPPILKQLVAQGQASVGLFFVLSGFILVYNYAAWFSADTSRFWIYARARFARIVPVYAFALLLATLPVLFFLHADPANAPSAAQLDLSWIANLLLVQVYVPLDHFQILWNGPAWSVAAECFFYLILPFFIRFILARLRRVRSLLLFAAGLFGVEIVVFVLGVTISAWLFPDPNDFALAMLRVVHKSPFLRVWEFLIGATLGAVFVRYREQPGSKLPRIGLDRPRVRNLALGLALVAILAIVFMPTPDHGGVQIGNTVRWYVAYTPFFALLILTLAWGPTFATRLLAHPWLVRLGEASYALYLLHAIPRSLIPLVAPEDARLTMWISLLVIIATVAASLGVYSLLEVPARRWLRGDTTAPRQLPLPQPLATPPG